MTSHGALVVGELDGGATPRVQQLKATLDAATPTTISTNIYGVLWSKLAINCTITTLGAVTGQLLGDMLRRGAIRRLGLGIVSGSGIAIAHPEGLRGVHTLDRIPPALSTAVFMTSGFFGFASGGAISATMVASYGLKGLYPLILCPIVGILAILLSGVHLAVERKETQTTDRRAVPRSNGLAFWRVLLIGLPAAVSTTLIVLLIPTYLDGLGFGLTFGGFSTAMFGWGGVIGPFVWAAIAHRKGDLPSAAWAFLLSVPFAILYFLFVESKPAAWLLFGVGFSSMAAYILTITLAREASGLRLGQRMAFVVGGTWGIAMVVFLVLAPVADRVGAGPILMLTPAGYLVSGLLALHLLRRHPELAKRYRAARILDLPAEEHTPV